MTDRDEDMERTASETPNHIESPGPAPEKSASQKSWAQTALDQFMELWITPYIIKKQAEGIFPKPLELKVARVIFFPDGRENLVQVNEEACLNRLKLKDGISKEKGEPIYEHEIDWSRTPRLPEEYKNCGHILLLRVGDNYHFSFDFKYNRAVNQNLIATARQFYDTASIALSKKHWSSFVDNLFSASELAVKCVVLSSLIIDRNEIDSYKGHPRMKQAFSGFAKLGNIQQDIADAYLKLTEMRNPARYLKGRDDMFVMDETQAQSLFERVGQLIDYAEKFIE